MMQAPHHSLSRNAKYTSILNRVTAAASALQDVSRSFQVPFIQAISALSFAIVAVVQSSKVQKQEYARLVEQIHGILWAIIDLCITSESADFLSPSILHNMGNFTQTLEKMHSLMEAQLTMGKFKRLLRGGNTQGLEECKNEMTNALEAFALNSTMSATEQLGKVQMDEESRHDELLALVAQLSTTTTSSAHSSFTGAHIEFAVSTNSLSSLLPPTPKIFHGRDTEVEEVTATLLLDSPRVAILGSGGMGKTSLATAVIHRTEIAQRYSQRYFITCDAAPTPADLVYIVASHVGSEPVRNGIFHALMAAPPTLLVLDNLEIPWEPVESRAEVEEFLSLLTDIPQLALLITMRGVERPEKVRWTRPFLAPLGLLSYDAARQTFLEISDVPEDNTEIDDHLQLTDHLPLAISLIANIVSFEGSTSTLRRWEEEHTTILSEGYNKRSNLDMSIDMSLSSPRMSMFPGARDLLAVIALLPDGILETDLMQCALPIQHIEKCKVTLIRTSLAYVDRDRRIKALAPVREYIRTVHPPSRELVRPLMNHLYQVLMLWKSFRQIPAPECVTRISGNLGNLQSVLLWELAHEDEDAAWKIRRYATTIFLAPNNMGASRILTLDSFLRATGKGMATLRAHIPDLLDRCTDHQVHGDYITALFEWQHQYESTAIPKDLEGRGIQEFRLANDAIGEVQLYNVLASYHLYNNDDPVTAESYSTRALSLSTAIEDSTGRGKALMHFAEIYVTKGSLRLAQKYAQEAQEAFRSSGRLVAQANAINSELACTFRLGDFRRSVELCSKARSLLAMCGMESSPLHVSLMNSEAEIHLLKTEYREARLIQTQIRDKTSKGQAPLEYAYALLNLAVIDCATGADETSIYHNLDMARAIFKELKSPGTMFWCDAVVADLQFNRNHKAEARACYEKWFSRLRAYPDFALVCLSKLGDLECGMHDSGPTFAYALILLGYARKTGNQVMIHHALRCIGDICAATGDDTTALILFSTALDGFSAMDVHQKIGECLVRMGGVLERRGKFAEAFDLLRRARVMFEKSSQSAQVSAIDQQLRSLMN
ncbi:hypothetical protein B0H19DRAFT_1275590 [Mycena capillaripes]|nr:hypothetical protein B0H19DRAFT_1275590 [Mycena capillaripes]